MSEPFYDRNESGRIAAARILDRMKKDKFAIRKMTGPELIAYATATCSQAELAQASGLTPVTITQLKHGRVRVSRSTRAAILWGLLELKANL